MLSADKSMEIIVAGRKTHTVKSSP